MGTMCPFGSTGTPTLDRSIGMLFFGVTGGAGVVSSMNMPPLSSLMSWDAARETRVVEARTTVSTPA